VAAKVPAAEAERITAAAEAAGITRSAWIANVLHRVLSEPVVTVGTVPSTSAAGAVSVTVEAHKAA
jgi:predicted Rdx family selenoprotein